MQILRKDIRIIAIVAAGIMAIATLSITLGCRHTSQISQLAEAEGFLPAEPDSADIRLMSVDIKQLREGEEKALYALIRIVTDAIQGQATPDEGLVHRAYTFYAQASHDGNTSTTSTLKHFAQAALYKGDWYAKQDSIKAAEDCYRQAIKASEKSEDWHTCYVSYQRLAKQLGWGNEEEALQLIEHAIKIYNKCNDNIQNLLSLYNSSANYKLQIAYFRGGSYQNSINDAHREYELAQSHHLTEYENQALCMLAHIYRIKDDNDSALLYARKINIYDSCHPLLWAREMASCYLACDSFVQAKAFYRLLAQSTDKKDRYLAISGLAEAAIQMGERDSAIFFMDSAFTCSEGMYLDALQAKDDYYQETLKQEREKEQLMYITKLRTWGFLFGILILLGGGLFSIRIILLKSKMHRQEKKHLLEKQEAMAENLHKKEATVKFLRKRIVDSADEAAKLKDGTPQAKLTKKEWTDIENLLNEIDDHRISHIRTRYPNLGTDDIRLCILVRLQLSNPVISQIYGITPSAVQHRKQTLKKKGFGIINSDITLDDVLESLV